ncbi:MAG: polysaccharide biosynthesis/export family protein [Candidatus Hydrogenedentota bacterium]|nr:MAG: polysaccharide biosynthesis/export family protein [Candidatus Hydrogenedentota bacterium]
MTNPRAIKSLRTVRICENTQKSLVIAVGLCTVFSLALVPSGCGTTEAQLVNRPPVAPYVSITDESSRVLAQNTRSMLGERSEDYRIGPEDVLEVTIFEWELREETKSVEIRVAESGIISLPVIGDIEVRGLTVAEVRRMIERRLFDGGFIREPRVSVSVREFRSKKIAVVGAVMDPGVYTLRQNVTTLLDILSLAGGVSDKAGYVLYVVRTRNDSSHSKHKCLPTDAPDAGSLKEPETGSSMNAAGQPTAVETAGTGNKELIAIDLYELVELGNLTLNVVLRDGDIVNVPEAKRFSAVGYVREPGSFPLKKPTTILEGIAMARGLKTPEASPRSCILRRYTPDGEVIIPFDLAAISEGRAPNLYLAPNDVIEVRQTTGRRIFLSVLDGFKYIFNVGYTF